MIVMMSLFAGSGRNRRNLRPRVVHSVSDSENEEREVGGDIQDGNSTKSGGKQKVGYLSSYLSS